MINSINYADNFRSFDCNLVYMRVPAEVVTPENFLSYTCFISIPFKGNFLPCFVWQVPKPWILISFNLKIIYLNQTTFLSNLIQIEL